jgi:hypothetical protein
VIDLCQFCKFLDRHGCHVAEQKERRVGLPNGGFVVICTSCVPRPERQADYDAYVMETFGRARV